MGEEKTSGARIKNVREETLPKAVHERPEAIGANGVLEVKTVGVKLGDAAGGDDDARLVAAKLEDVEGREKRLAKGRRDAVVGRADPGEEVDVVRGAGAGAGDGAAGVGAYGFDGDGEELLLRHGCCCVCVCGIESDVMRRRKGVGRIEEEEVEVGVYATRLTSAV